MSNEFSRTAFSVMYRDHLKRGAFGFGLPVGVLLLERVSLCGVQDEYERLPLPTDLERVDEERMS